MTTCGFSFLFKGKKCLESLLKLMKFLKNHYWQDAFKKEFVLQIVILHGLKIYEITNTLFILSVA